MGSNKRYLFSILLLSSIYFTGCTPLESECPEPFAGGMMTTLEAHYWAPPGVPDPEFVDFACELPPATENLRLLLEWQAVKHEILLDPASGIAEYTEANDQISLEDPTETEIQGCIDLVLVALPVCPLPPP